MSTPEVFVVSALRTAIGGFGGSLKDVSPIELGTQVSRAALAKSGIAPEHIGHVVMGHVIPTEVRDAYLSRVIALDAGLTKETPAMNVNRLCGSGLQAIVSAAQSLMLGDARAVLAGGAESMSRGAYIMPQARWGARMGNVQAYDYMLGALHDPFANIHMGITAENIAEHYGITRADQDALALTSQQRAAHASPRAVSRARSCRSRSPRAKAP
jgi:acetyl-CoA C-acetyltransferase